MKQTTLLLLLGLSLFILIIALIIGLGLKKINHERDCYTRIDYSNEACYDVYFSGVNHEDNI